MCCKLWPGRAMAAVGKSALLWIRSETRAPCSGVFTAWLQSVLPCVVVPGLRCWFEMNVNLGETIKLIFPGNWAIK